MIEIAIALSMASTAMSNIKKGIEVGKQFRDVVHEFGKLFDARDAIMEAQQAKGSDMTVVDGATGKALNTALMIRDINHFENWLKDQLIYSGQADVYEEFVAQRELIRKGNAEAKKRQQIAKKKRKDEIDELIDVLFWGGFALLILGALMWGGIELLHHCKAIKCGVSHA